MHTEYAEWFKFVSSHRVRFCFSNQLDAGVFTQPGNVNGACFRENSLFAIMWYLQSNDMVVPPNKGQDILEYSITYEDITSKRLGSILAGTHKSININDSAMWKSRDLVMLQTDPEAQLAYASRKGYVLNMLEACLPASEFKHAKTDSE